MKAFVACIRILLPVFFLYTSIPVFSQGSMQSQPYKNHSIDTLDDYVKGRMQKLRIPGLSMAVLKNGKMLTIRAYGESNLETGTPVTPESRFMIASLTKQFIATAILLLKQDGKLSLEDKIGKYLDSIPEQWEDITLKQLLTHTSGILRDPADYHPYTDQPVIAVIKSMQNLAMNGKPGEKWLYSNAGYYILAEVITRVSGQPWDQFIRQEIFVPAGLSQTMIGSNKEIISNRVNGYHTEGEKLVNAERWVAVRPSSAFISSIKDLAKWDSFIDHSTLLTPESRALLWTRGQLNDKSMVNYGLGWYVESFLGFTWIHHDGQFPGFRNAYERLKEDSLTVIMLANSDNRGIEALAMNVATLFDPELRAPVFTVDVKSPKMASPGDSIKIEITIRDKDKPSAGSIVEMEIWNDQNKSVYKQQQYNVNFEKGKTSTMHFTWKPEKPGVYTINIGTYGPHWIPFSWNEHFRTITVRGKVAFYIRRI